jgi:tRNA threonylcarbamoyl adenosine modification protein (Sua5/YciO/YrdC/YwlC family)
LKTNGHIINGIQRGTGHVGWKEEICIACECLKTGKIIAVPTDTIYGIAGLAQNTSAVNRIYQIKNRQNLNPISICVGDVKDVYRWGEVTITDNLLQELLPGPVTVVFKRTVELNADLNPATHLVGIRVPDYGFVREVARQCREPLALTSANPSTAPSTVSIEEFQCLWPHLGLVFDGGKLGNTPESRLGSTVVDLSQAGQYKIIRPGSACKETVEKLEKHGLCDASGH